MRREFYFFKIQFSILPESITPYIKISFFFANKNSLCRNYVRIFIESREEWHRENAKSTMPLLKINCHYWDKIAVYVYIIIFLYSNSSSATDVGEIQVQILVFAAWGQLYLWGFPAPPYIQSRLVANSRVRRTYSQTVLHNDSFYFRKIYTHTHTDCAFAPSIFRTETRQAKARNHVYLRVISLRKCKCPNQPQNPSNC